MPVGFRRHLVGKTSEMFVTVISLKYSLLVSYDHRDIVLDQLILSYLNYNAH